MAIWGQHNSRHLPWERSAHVWTVLGGTDNRFDRTQHTRAHRGKHTTHTHTHTLTHARTFSRMTGWQWTNSGCCWCLLCLLRDFLPSIGWISSVYVEWSPKVSTVGKRSLFTTTGLSHRISETKSTGWWGNERQRSSYTYLHPRYGAVFEKLEKDGRYILYNEWSWWKYGLIMN